jgi:L-alanine-DL-glutamate epimerase-like enolase superfamily enzyme
MKITRIEATPLAIPLAQEFHWAGGAQHGANLVLFAVHTDEGAVGYGESICEDPRAVTAYGELMARQLIGRSPGEMEAILRSIWSEGRWKMFPQFTQLSFAGIEVACWDALGRALGVPTRTFFGGQVQQEIDYFGFLQGDDPATLAEHARQLSGEGFEVIYLKVGRGIERDDSCVAAVREAIGPDRLLRIDPNEAWDPATAVDRIRLLERYDLDWVEQPTPAGDVNGLAHVRRSVGVKIAADQAVFTTSQLLHVLEKEAADVVVQGSHDAGGLLRFRQQAFVCDAFGLRVNRHAFMESEISFYANAQVASTIPNLTLGNQVMHQLLAERLTLGPPPELAAGKYRPGDAPGHGFELDHEAVGVAHERWQRDGAYNTVESVAVGDGKGIAS